MVQTSHLRCQCTTSTYTYMLVLLTKIYIHIFFLTTILSNTCCHVAMSHCLQKSLWRKAPDHIIRVNSWVTVVLVPSFWWSESFPTTVPVFKGDIATDNSAIPLTTNIFVKPNPFATAVFFHNINSVYSAWMAMAHESCAYLQTSLWNQI